MGIIGGGDGDYRHEPDSQDVEGLISRVNDAVIQVSKKLEPLGLSAEKTSFPTDLRREIGPQSLNLDNATSFLMGNMESEDQKVRCARLLAVTIGGIDGLADAAIETFGEQSIITELQKSQSALRELAERRWKELPLAEQEKLDQLHGQMRQHYRQQILDCVKQSNHQPSGLIDLTHLQRNGFVDIIPPLQRGWKKGE